MGLFFQHNIKGTSQTINFIALSFQTFSIILNLLFSEVSEESESKPDDNYNYQLMNEILVHSKNEFSSKSEMMQYSEVLI